MFTAVPLYPEYASTILQSNALLENLCMLVNILLECFTNVVTSLLEYTDLFSHWQ